MGSTLTTPLSALKISSEATASDYFSLLKPRVMSLVVFTGWVGLLLAPGTLHPFIAFVAIACIAVGAGASGAINMWYDRDIDAIMGRTKNRPIPAGRIRPHDALAFGVILSIVSTLTMAVLVNLVAASLLVFSILFYVFIYTMALKRTTPQNIVIGGAAGAIPPMIGWAAVTHDVSLDSLSLFLIIFMWTPPHFWALALYRWEDYSDANVPMLPVTHGIRATQWHIIAYTCVLIPLTFLPWWLGVVGPLYGMAAALLGLVFFVMSLRILRADYDKPARHLFTFSIAYLFMLYLMMIVDKLR